MLFVAMFVIQGRPDGKTNSLRRLILSGAVLEMVRKQARNAVQREANLVEFRLFYSMSDLQLPFFC